VANVRYDGRDVELLDPERIMLGERGWAERRHPRSHSAAGWTGAESDFCTILISFKRAGVVLSWDLFETSTVGGPGSGCTFELTADPEPEEAPDPTTPDLPDLPPS
jgi:hypothetical protein